MQEHWALEELQHDILKRDIIKAKLVIDEFENLDQIEQEAILDELESAPGDFSLPLIIYLFQILPGVPEKFPEIMDVYYSIAQAHPDSIIAGLKPFSRDTLYYIQLAEKTGLKTLVPYIEKILKEIDDPHFQIASLSYLGKNGSTKSLDGIFDLLKTNHFAVSAEAVSAISQIGTDKAVYTLSKGLGINVKLDTLILDTLAEIQSEAALKILSENLGNLTAIVRNHARRWLAMIGEESIPAVIPNLDLLDSDIKILSLNVLTEIGSKNAIPHIKKLILNRPKDPNIRFAAYEALSQLSSKSGDYTLAGGLEDPDSNVRLVAARAIEKNLNPTLAAGVCNMVSQEGENTDQIVKAIIDSSSGKLFKVLLPVKAFTSSVSSYLGQSNDQDISAYFLKILTEAKETSIVEKITNLAKNHPDLKKGKVCAVDDSKMILSLYRSAILQLGYEPILFDNGTDALEWLKSEKPDILCSDLNMPIMTGVELIQKVRKIYTKENLPIFLVTTQSEVKSDQSFEHIEIDAIIHKPFDATVLEENFSKYS